MPVPRRKKGQSKTAWRNDVIRAEIEHGKPREQAVAIGYSVTGTSRRGKKKQ